MNLLLPHTLGDAMLALSLESPGLRLTQTGGSATLAEDWILTPR